MLKINMQKVEKYFGVRKLLDIEEFKIYSDDRIGMIGVNGVGKTTLLRMITGEEKEDYGNIFRHKSINIKYVSQLDGPDENTINGKMASIFQVNNIWSENMSGGEKTRFKLAQAFQGNYSLLLVDEPTSNLDLQGIELITRNFEEYSGTFVVVSHDRDFLDRTCNKILEIEAGKVKIYHGNYSKYKELKAMEVERQKFEYDEYIREKNRLLGIRDDLVKKSDGLRDVPKRMGNSEARLFRRQGSNAKKNLDSDVKSIESRINQLEEKERPVEEAEIKIKMLESNKPYGKILVSGKNINKSFGEKVIFKKAEFNIYNGKKIGLLGPNGSGKTTLINMIMNKEDIKISKNVKIGYFSQSMDILDENKSILENVMETSIHDENFVRLFLARLLFRANKVYDKVKVLSGGERVKLSFAKIILSDINFLILDEPTNYLDMISLEVIEETLINYDGSLLLVSHDREFLSSVTNDLLIIENKQIKSYRGGYEEYIKGKKEKSKPKVHNEMEKMVLDNKLTELIGRISLEENEEVKAELNKTYEEVLIQLKRL